ncbi:hypothetical protein [Nocardioides sp.]
MSLEVRRRFEEFITASGAPRNDAERAQLIAVARYVVGAFGALLPDSP